MRLVTLITALVLSVGCKKPRTGEGIFVGGCPVSGESQARFLETREEEFEGPAAVGGKGDLLLMNDHVAFAISGIDEPKGWLGSAGSIVDGVAVDVDLCEQTTDDQLGELAFVVGQLDASLALTTLRLLRGERVRVVENGDDGGPAVVEVEGIDDTLWPVELGLQARAVAQGQARSLSTSYGLASRLRYTLEPDSDVLEVEITLQNSDDAPKSFLLGAALVPSPYSTASAYASEALSDGQVGVGIPFVEIDGHDPDGGAYAVGIEATDLAYTHIEGVEVLLHGGHLTEPIELPSLLDISVDTYLFAAGGEDGSSAVAALWTVDEEPGETYVRRPVDGVCEDPNGLTVFCHVKLQRLGDDDVWRTQQTLEARIGGGFAGLGADFGDSWRLVGTSAGREAPPPTVVDPQDAVGQRLVFGPVGRVDLDVQDAAGQSLPVLMSLVQGGVVVEQRHVLPGEQPKSVPPGDYQLVVTRGYRYGVFRQALTVREDERTAVSVVLERVVDTAGWLSFDSDVHGAGSHDSMVGNWQRARSVGTSGLDVVVMTDHDAANDLGPALSATGAGAWAASVVGVQVSAPIPESTMAFPILVNPNDDRGGAPPWVGLDLAQIVEAERDVGAQVVQLAQARSGCAYLCLIDWDPVLAAPRLTDPTVLGMPATAALWTWDLDLIELMSGHESPLTDVASPQSSGLLDDWLGMVNQGYPVTAIASANAHDAFDLGSPLSFVRSSIDDPNLVDDAVFSAAVLDGGVVLSTGAFIDVQMGGDGPGSLADNAPLNLKVRALPEVDVDEVAVLVNCTEVLRLPATDPAGLIKLDVKLDLGLVADSQVVVIAWGSGLYPAGLPQFDPTNVPRALSNPIYVDVDGDGRWAEPGPVVCSYGGSSQL